MSKAMRRQRFVKRYMYRNPLHQRVPCRNECMLSCKYAAVADTRPPESVPPVCRSSAISSHPTLQFILCEFHGVKTTSLQTMWYGC